MLIQAALGLVGLAWAGPQTFTTSGRLLDADGAAIDGTLSTSFSLLDGGSAVWTETQAVSYQSGYYAAVLGVTNPLDPVRLAAPLTLRVSVGGTTLAEQPLSAVPYARSVHGLVQVDLNGACTPALEGALSTQGGGLSICRGSAWREVEPPVPAGCREPLPISAVTLSPDNGGAAALRDGLPYNLASWSGYPTNQVFEVAIDLGSTQRVCGVAYTTDWHTKSPLDVQLQTSTDGSAWTTAATVVGTHSAVLDSHFASPRSDNTFALSANTRYVRLRVTSTRNPGTLMLGEVYVYTYE